MLVLGYVIHTGTALVTPKCLSRPTACQQKRKCQQKVSAQLNNIGHKQSSSRIEKTQHRSTVHASSQVATKAGRGIIIYISPCQLSNSVPVSSMEHVQDKMPGPGKEVRPKRQAPNIWQATAPFKRTNAQG